MLLKNHIHLSKNRLNTAYKNKQRCLFHYYTNLDDYSKLNAGRSPFHYTHQVWQKIDQAFDPGLGVGTRNTREMCVCVRVSVPGCGSEGIRSRKYRLSKGREPKRPSSVQGRDGPNLTEAKRVTEEKAGNEACEPMAESPEWQTNVWTLFPLVWNYSVIQQMFPYHLLCAGCWDRYSEIRKEKQGMGPCSPC